MELTHVVGKETPQDILLASARSDDLKLVVSSVQSNENRVFTAYSIEKIVSFLARRSFALIVVDSGLEQGVDHAVTALRSMEHGRDVPWMVLTDHDGESGAGDFYAMGAVDVLIRPVDPVAMKNKIAFYIERFQLKMRCDGQGEMGQPPRDEMPDRKMNRALAELAGGIAHQFNNSLNIITGHVELLKMDLPDNGFVHDFSGVVFDSVKKMTGLTDKLLAYARAGRNCHGKVELNGMLEEGLTEACYPRDRITIETAFDSGNILVDADESQLRMVFAAVFKNAVEAIRDAGRITVTTRYLPGGDRRGTRSGTGLINVVCLEIKDNGEGMSREVSERMFEPFFSTKFQGRGLDMAAAQGIVTSHGGWIDVQSSAGEGTTVSVYFPVSSYRPASVFSFAENCTDESAGVLVVDDDDSIRDLTVTMLKRLGYQAVSASTGWEAIEMAERLKDKLDLAIVDIEMPDMKGDELYPHLMDICPHLKVIVCSGYSVEGPGETMIRNGAQLFMQKPFSFGDLAVNMRKLIERRRDRRYRVMGGLAVFQSDIRQFQTSLIDISLRGAAVQAMEAGMAVSVFPEKMVIVSESGLVSVSDIPFQVLARGLCFNPLKTEIVIPDRMNLRFGFMTRDKQQEVEHFIAHCAVQGG